MQNIVSALGRRRVIILAEVPEPGVNVPPYSALHEQWGRPPLRLTCAPPHTSVIGAIVADMSDAFCAYPEPWRLFVDRNHPSMTANREVIAPALAMTLSRKVR